MSWHLKKCQNHSSNPLFSFHPCIFLCPQSCHLFSKDSGFDYLFVCFSDKCCVYPLCLACASRDCLQAPHPLCTRISPKELFTTMMLAKTNPLIVAGLWVFLNASVFRSRLCQILTWEYVCRNTYGTTQHCYLSSTCLLLVLFSSHVVLLSFLDVSSAGQGLDHSWHLRSSLFHLIDFYCYMSFENQRKMLCWLSALVLQSLCKVHWWPLKKKFLSKAAAIFHWYCDNVKACFMVLMLNQFIKGKTSHGRWDCAFIQLSSLPPVGLILQVHWMHPSPECTAHSCTLGISFTTCIFVFLPRDKTWSIGLPASRQVALLSSGWLSSSLLFSVGFVI